LKNLPKKHELSQVIGKNQISNIYFDNTLRSDSIKINFNNSKSNKYDKCINTIKEVDNEIIRKIEEKNSMKKLNNNNNINTNNLAPKKDSNNSNKLSDSGISERLAKINSKIQKFM